MLLTLASLAVAFAPGQVVPTASTGGYSRRVQTRSVSAQKHFDEGLALLYAFQKKASQDAFAKAAKADPSCAMAQWGQALALASDINNPVLDGKTLQLAKRHATQALKLSKPGIERELASSAVIRFSPKASPVGDKEYAKAMAKLWYKYPKDPDIGALYAESLLTLSPWDNYKADGSPKPETTKSIAALRQVLALSPKHLLANHIMIHAIEASKTPEMGLNAAETLTSLNLSLGHLVHMPSHIYVRTGMWKAAVDGNALAIQRDRAFVAKNGTPPTYLGYMAHNRMMLAFAGCMNGSYTQAKDAISDLRSLMPAPMLKEMAWLVDGFWMMPLDVERRFGHWEKILAEPEPPEFLPIARAQRLANRAVAFAAMGKHDEADFEYASFKLARANVAPKAIYGLNTAETILDLEENFVAGELAVLRGNYAEGFKSLQAAIKIEDHIRYNEPPDWIQPVRHTLGAAYLKAGMPAKAVEVYKQDLVKQPHNGWSLRGLDLAYTALGNKAEAAKYRKQYEAVWSKSDTPAGSSCRCLPNS